MTQTQHRLAHTLLLACVFAAFTGSANADIVKCIDGKGSVLITDVPCKTGTAGTRVASVTKKPPVGTMSSDQQRRFAETERVRANMAKNSRPASRKFALDVTTAAAARASLQSIDQAWALQRQQALAEQEVRPSIWEFWRS